jgi:hypothetical protein
VLLRLSRPASSPLPVCSVLACGELAGVIEIELCAVAEGV